MNETTGGKRRTKRNTQSKQVQKLQAFVFPGSDSQFRVKRPSTTNAKSSYEKLLEYCAQQNPSQTPISYDQQKTTNTGIMEIRDTNTRSRGDTRGMFLAFPKTKNSLESKQNPFVRFQSGGNDKLIYSQVGEIMQRDRSVIPPEEEREMHPSEKHVLNDWEKMLTASSYIVKPDSSDTACNKMRKMPNLVDGNVSSNASKLQCTHTPSASLIQELLFPQTTRVIHRCNECSIVIPFRSTQYAVYSQQSRGPRNEMLCDRCHFSMIANKRQKEVNAHVSKLKPTHKKPKSHILCSKEGKQIRLARLQHRQNEIAERTKAHRSKNQTHAMNNFIEPDRASNSGLSTSSMSGESDNDSLKDDLLCSFDKSRQFDHRLCIRFRCPWSQIYMVGKDI